MRLIDIDSDFIASLFPDHHQDYQTFNLDDAYDKGWEDALDNLEDAPTIDAVRAAGGCYCQECKYADYPIGPNILCKKFYGAGSIDGFCYWGQRKEDEHEAR